MDGFSVNTRLTAADWKALSVASSRRTQGRGWRGAAVVVGLPALTLRPFEAGALAAPDVAIVLVSLSCLALVIGLDHVAVGPKAEFSWYSTPILAVDADDPACTHRGRGGIHGAALG